MDSISKSKLFLILIIPLIISGCSMPSIPDIPLPDLSLPLPELPNLPNLPGLPSLQSIPFLGEIAKRLPFIPHEEEEKVNESSVSEGNESVTTHEERIDGSETEKEEKIGESAGVNESRKEEEIQKTQISKMNVYPVYAELNRSTGIWNVVFKLQFITNIKGEEGKWQLFLYDSEGLIDKKSIDTVKTNVSGIDVEIEGFSVNYAVKHVKEGYKYKIKAIREVRLLQPGGSTAASYKLQKEMDVNFKSKVELLRAEVSCSNILYKINFSGLLPAKVYIEVKFSGGKTFTKTFRVVGGEEYSIDFDGNLNRGIFEVRNGESEIYLNLEKFLRIASTPESEVEIVLKSDKVLSTIKFAKPNVSVESKAGKLLIKNEKNSSPIYIDSIVLVDYNAKTIPVGTLLCDKIELDNSYHGEILVIGGPNLFWSEYKERYLTKKPEYILFRGEI